jgi:S1-C subfamily serine protease
MRNDLSSLAVLGIFWTLVQMQPASAQQGWVLINQNPDYAISVRQTSVRRDPQDGLVLAELAIRGDRGAFSYLSVPYKARVRTMVALVRLDCVARRMFERSSHFYARDGGPLGQQEFPGQGFETQLTPGSMVIEAFDWICARAPAALTTGASTTDAPRETNDPPSTPESNAPVAGSAFTVSATDLLTNDHVVDGCSDVTVTDSNRNSFEGRVRTRDVRNDLALISVEATRLTSVARFRTTGIRAGEDVIAVGFPLPGLLATELNVSRGIVSATAGLLNDTSQLQISAEVQPGNSGGPLLDATGAVAGVVVSKLDAIALAVHTGDIPQNVNFAIKSELAAVFLRSHGIEPRSAPVTGGSVAISDIVDRARAYTFLVECVPEG